MRFINKIIPDLIKHSSVWLWNIPNELSELSQGSLGRFYAVNADFPLIKEIVLLYIYLLRWEHSTWVSHWQNIFVYCLLETESQVLYFDLNPLGHSHDAHDECWLPAAAASTNGQLLSGGYGEAQSAWSLSLKSSAPKNYTFLKF